MDAMHKVTADKVTHEQLVALRREAGEHGDYAVCAVVDHVLYGDEIDGDDWEPATVKILNRLGAASWTKEKATAYCVDIINHAVAMQEAAE